MTLKIWEPKAVGVSNHLIKYQGNRWWNMLAKAGTDRQTEGRTVCRSEEWHTQHTITPNKWPKHKRKNLRKIRNGAWAYIVLRGCQTNALRHMFIKKTSFSNDLKKRVFLFSLSKMCLSLMCISFITRVVLILGYFFVSKSVALKDPKKGLESNGTQLLYQQLY